MKSRTAGLLLILWSCSACNTLSQDSFAAKASQPLTVLRGEAGLRIDTINLAQWANPSPGPMPMSNLQKLVVQGAWQDVIDLARAQLKKQPGDKLSLSWLAIAYAALGDQSKGRFYAELTLRDDPKNAYTLNLLGILTWREAYLIEDYRRALALFNLAAQSSPELTAPRLNMAYMYLRLGNLETALTEFAIAEKQCERCRGALLGAAIAAQKLGRYPEALDKLEILIKANKEDALANYLMGLHVSLYEKNQGKSRQWFEKVLESAQSNIELNEKARYMIEQSDIG